MTRCARSTKTSGLRVLMLTVVAGFCGCNTRTPIHDNSKFVTAPTGWANAAVPNGPAGDLARIDLSPTVTIGGGGGRGTVFLDGPAPEGGLAVSLVSAASATVIVNPPVVVVPTGAFSADFSYTTISVTRDADISITASTPSRSLTTRVSLWAAVLPSFYFHVADRNELIHGPAISRVTSDMNARFEASCSRNVVHASIVQASTVTHDLSFAAAGSQPLRPGVYDDATPNGSGNHMRVGSFLSCVSVGRFLVRELDINASGDVTSLWVTFEAGCPGRPGTLHGAFRATNPRRTVNAFPCVAAR